jgi:tetratricopeptide (TPR) repeat protein
MPRCALLLPVALTLLAPVARPQAETAPSISSRRLADTGPLIVTGRVVLEDGSPAGAGVDIQSCAPTVQTAPDGNFTLTTQDATRDPKGCPITASKPGFDSAVLKIMVTSGTIDIGDITLRKVKEADEIPAGTSISEASLDAPEPAWKAFEKGRKATEKKKWKDAEKRLQEAVRIYPRFAQAWATLGNVYRDQNRADEARAAYEKAAEADPNYVPPRLGLAAFALQSSDWKKVEELTSRIIQQSPSEFPEAYLYRASALYNSGKYELAAVLARRGIEIDGRKRFPKLQHLLGVVLARQGHYQEALAYLRSYLNYGAGSDAAEVRKQIASIEAAAK